MTDRLGKLARLTRGAALVGIGAGVLACSKSEPPTQPHTSGPFSVDGTSDDAGPGDASAFPFRRRLPVPNAIPTYLPRLPDAGGGGSAPP
jgi:hypothetical protein